MNPRLPERLLDWVRRVCPADSLAGCASPFNADAVRVAYPPAATVAQQKAALDSLGTFDATPAAQLAWEVSRASLLAVGLVGTSTDPIYTADRVILRYLCTALNDVRANAGLPRVLEAEIVAGLVAAAAAGAGAPAALPGGG